MATGLLNLAPQPNEVASYDPAKAAASKPTTVGYDPSQFSVQPKATVAQQFQDLSSMDSPLLKQARARATNSVNQKMNQRGMINSSMGLAAVTEAADQAVYDKILPIAQQDATTHFTADTNTTNADNAAKYAKMQADNTASLRGAELDTNVSLANADAMNKQGAQAAEAASRVQLTGMETSRALALADKEFERAMGTAQLDATTRLQLAEMDQETRMNLANVDRETRVELATIENNYRQLLQMNGDLATMYNQVSTNIANISMSNMSAQAKQDATNSQLNILKETLRAKQGVMSTNAHQTPTEAGPSSLVGNMNIGSYFTNGTTSTGAVSGAGGSSATNSNIPAGYYVDPNNGTTWKEVSNPPAGWKPGSPAPSGYIVGSNGKLWQKVAGLPAKTTASGGSTGSTGSGGTTPAIPSWGQAAPQYGAGAYTYASGGRTMLHVPGKGDRPL